MLRIREIARVSPESAVSAVPLYANRRRRLARINCRRFASSSIWIVGNYNPIWFGCAGDDRWWIGRLVNGWSGGIWFGCAGDGYKRIYGKMATVQLMDGTLKEFVKFVNYNFFIVNYLDKTVFFVIILASKTAIRM